MIKRFLKVGDAISYLIEYLPGTKKFAWLIKQGAGKKAVDFFYEKTNELRKSIKETNCGQC